MAKSSPAPANAAPLARPATVVIARITPSVDGGLYPAKRIAGERIRIEADIFKDGHDQLAAVVKWRKKGARAWEEAPMVHGN